ncbi:hypothetical protein MJ584_22925 [Klebsiella pneumoniae]|nr:hypothetical protein MJ584_22925 [Klebsiella pneumoniae]
MDRAEDFQAVMTEALAMPGPSVVEVKMGQIGALALCRPAAEDAVLMITR